MTARFADHLLDGDHASRPTATAVPTGALYACSDHALVYQSDGTAWATWATLGETGGATALQAHLDDTTDAHDATAISYAGSSGLTATTVEAALDELDTEKVAATGTITKINGPITQAAYDALTPDADTLYVIVG